MELADGVLEIEDFPSKIRILQSLSEQSSTIVNLGESMIFVYSADEIVSFMTNPHTFVG